MKLYDRKGQAQEVPDEQVKDALASGQYGLPAGQSVPVNTADGPGHVLSENLHDALAGGATLATPEQLKAHALQKQYGSPLQGLEAGAQAALSGATLGLSDVAAGKLLSPEHLAAFKGREEANPIATKVGGVVGAVAPIAADVLTGGALTPEIAAGAAAAKAGAEVVPEAAEAIRAASPAGWDTVVGGALHNPGAAEAIRAATSTLPDIAGNTSGRSLLARTLSAPVDAVSHVGDMAAQATRAIVGDQADSAAGRLIQRAIATGSKTAAEGAVYAGMQQTGQNALDQDPQLFGEKFLHAVGYGALLGGGLGTAGSLLTSGVRAARGLAQETGAIDDMIGHQATASLDAKGPAATKAIKQIGAAELGHSWMDVLRKVTDEKGPAAAFMTNDGKLAELRPYLSGLIDEAQDKLKSSDAQVTLRDVLAPLDKRIEEFRPAPGSGKAGQGHVADYLTGIRDDIVKILGRDPEAEAMARAPQAAPVPRNPEEIANILQTDPRAKMPGFFKPDGTPPDWVMFENPPTPPPAPAALDKAISIADIYKQKQSLQEEAYKAARTLNPTVPVQQLREFTGELNTAIEKAMNDAAQKAGGELEGTQMRALNKRIRNLIAIQDILENNQIRYAKNDTRSLTSKIAGAAAGAGMLAHGNVIGALGAAGGAMLGADAVKYHGNTAAAMLLDRMLSNRAASKIVSLDRSTTKAVDAIWEPKLGRTAGKAAAKPTDQSSYSAKVDAVNNAVTSDGHQQAVSRLAGAMGPSRMSQAFAQASVRTTAYLASQIPRNPLDQGQMFTSEYQPSDIERARFVRQYDAVTNPVGVLDKVASGTVTPDEVHAIMQTSPALYQSMVRQVTASVGKQKKPPPYHVQQSIKTFLGVPIVPASLGKMLQDAYGPGGGAIGAPAPKRPRASRPIEGYSEAAALPGQKSAARSGSIF